MESSAQQETVAAEVAGDGDLHPPEGTRVRRRLIQSTLFPHRSQDNGKESVVIEGEDCDRDEDQDDEEEEYCGSQSRKKRKRKRKPNALPQSRGSKKVAVNGKETPNMQVDDQDSPVIVKSEFFLKASEKRHQKKQQKEPLCVSSPEENDYTCSPPDAAANLKSPRQSKKRANTTPKRRGTTPKKNMMNGDPKEASSRQIPTDPTESEHTPQQIPDLRLEAKMMAEENSRIFEGRQIHPFFSSWKMGKGNQETTSLEGNWCSFERKDKNITFHPIHVFEMVQDDEVSLEWGNWIFFDGSFLNTDRAVESMCSPAFKGSVKALHFDSFLSNLTRTLLQNEVHLDQFAIQEEEVILDHSPTPQKCLHRISPIILDDEQVTHHDTLDRQCRCVEEWMMPYYHGCHYRPENCLWTFRYQPEKAIEVCGNIEPVKFLSEWLHLWHEKGFQTSKSSTVQDADWNCCKSDSEPETVDEDYSLKNVLLVTGPVGSGKSAAIYACAKEQGFQIIEVNSSDWRNGALVKQRFGEAVESHWLQRTLENPVVSEGKHLLKSSPSIPNVTAAQWSDNEVIELIPLSDEEDSQNANGRPGKFIHKNNKIVSDQNEIKTLILFEDVDVTLHEDRGFTATIQQLAETAKRPMILTCNSANPILPNNLDRLEVCFTTPSLKELLHHVHMVCAAEKANIQPSLLDRFIEYCQGDIRKTIMHLQFWCQGQRYGKDREVQKTYGPLPFDLDAGHQILPTVIPWGYPSQLSELVEKEITKSLLMMEENTGLTEVVEEEVNCNEICNDERESIEAKKEAMLSRHCSGQDGNELIGQFDTASDFASLSCSPVAFTRRNVRRKLGTVLSSSSGDEDFNERCPEVAYIPFEDRNDEMLLEVNSKSPSPPHCLAETADDSHIYETCESIDVSCVPESSFVPETEINNGMEFFATTLSYSHVADMGEAVSIGTDLIQNLLPTEDVNLEKSSNGLDKSSEILGTFDIDMESILLPIEADNDDRSLNGLNNLNKHSEIMGTFDIDTETIHGEDVGNSHIESVEAVPRVCHVMDECSRMDFSRGSKSIKLPMSSLVTDFVQETWKKLRVCHADIRQHVTPELKDSFRVMNLASSMCNVMADTDLLLGDCQPLVYDSLEPGEVPCEEARSFSWYDDQLQMSSAFAQHGICFYAKEVTVLGSRMGSLRRVDLAREMLASSISSVALGKLVNQEMRSIRSLETGPPRNSISSKSEFNTCLSSIVQSIIPPRSYLASKGDAFHEYLSSLGRISRSEASRLSENIQKTKGRRRRVARHYLSTGALMLSPEDISLLGRYNCYRKHPSQSLDTSLS